MLQEISWILNHLIPGGNCVQEFPVLWQLQGAVKMHSVIEEEEGLVCIEEQGLGAV